MTFMDKQATLSNEQSLTATALSTNNYDSNPNTSSPNLTVDISGGSPIFLHCLVTTTMTSGGAGTLTATLESDDNTSLSSATTHATFASLIALATMVAGYWVARNYQLPAGDYQRYIGLRYTVGTADYTAGKLTAWLSPDKVDVKTYKGAYTLGIT